MADADATAIQGASAELGVSFEITGQCTDCDVALEPNIEEEPDDDPRNTGPWPLRCPECGKLARLDKVRAWKYAHSGHQERTLDLTEEGDS